MLSLLVEESLLALVYCHSNKIKISNHVALGYESRSLAIKPGVLAWKVKKDSCPAKTNNSVKEASVVIRKTSSNPLNL